MRQLYCVQRLKRGETEITHDVGLSKAYPLDYMGAAEFEFGAYGKIVTALYEQRDSIVLAKVPIVDNARKTTLNVFYSPVLLESTGITFEEVCACIRNMNTGTHPHKCHTNFYERNKVREGHTLNTVAWMAIRNGVFFTCDNITVAQFITMISASVRVYAAIANR